MQFKRIREEDIRLVNAVERFDWLYNLEDLLESTYPLDAMWVDYDIDSGDLGAGGQPLMDVTLLGENDLELKEDLARKFNFPISLFEDYNCTACAVMSLASRVVHDGIKGVKRGNLVEFSDGWFVRMGDAAIPNMLQNIWPLDSTEGSAVAQANMGFIQLDAGLVVMHVGLLTADPDYTSATLDNTIATLGRIPAISRYMKNLKFSPSMYFTSLKTIKVPIVTCTIERDEFIYSTNPTFTSQTELTPLELDSIASSPINIRTFVDSKTSPRCATYITRIGLYDINNRLLAIAKLPITKNDNSKILKFDVPLFLRQ